MKICLLLIEVFRKLFNTQNYGHLVTGGHFLFIRVSKNFALQTIQVASINAGGLIVIRPPHQSLITSPSIQFLNIRGSKNFAFRPSSLHPNNARGQIRITPLWPCRSIAIDPPGVSYIAGFLGFAHISRKRLSLVADTTYETAWLMMFEGNERTLASVSTAWSWHVVLTHPDYRSNGVVLRHSPPKVRWVVYIGHKIHLQSHPGYFWSPFSPRRTPVNLGGCRSF